MKERNNNWPPVRQPRSTTGSAYLLMQSSMSTKLLHCKFDFTIDDIRYPFRKGRSRNSSQHNSRTRRPTHFISIECKRARCRTKPKEGLVLAWRRRKTGQNFLTDDLDSGHQKGWKKKRKGSQLELDVHLHFTLKLFSFCARQRRN